MGPQNRSDRRASDFLGSPWSAIFWWGLPLALGWTAGLLPIPPVAQTLAWVVALGWMGTGCALNAHRCHRLHCYISAPILFLGAVGATLTALGWTPLGPHTSSFVINGSLFLALLTFLAEPIWGKYRTR